MSTEPSLRAPNEVRGEAISLNVFEIASSSRFAGLLAMTFVHTKQ